MIAAELIALLKQTLHQFSISYEAFATWDFYDFNKRKENREEVEQKLFGVLGKIKLIDNGYDIYDHDIEYSVFYFADHDMYLRMDGFCSRNEPTDWIQDLYQVKPVQKTIEIYESVEEA